MIGTRVADQHFARDGVSDTQPLRWLVHGGPGTGKTYLIDKIRGMFEDVCHWTHGLDFQIVA